MQIHKNPPQGFTLLEVLVVVAIIGILAGLGVSSLRAKIAEESVKGEGMNIKAYLERVGAQAKGKGQDRSVSFSGSTLQAYTGSTCVTANAIAGLSEVLDAKTAPNLIITSLPSLPTGTGTWNGACIPYRPASRIGLNPLDTIGYIRIQSTSLDQYQALIAKIATDNRYILFMTNNSGTTWRQL